MPFGTKYDRKLARWVVYNKATGKILGKHDSKESANKQLAALNINVRSA